LAALSCGFEADGTNEDIEIIGYPLMEANRPYRRRKVAP
jgi:hypothetical protein